jgi:hypothetical protein
LGGGDAMVRIIRIIFTTIRLMTPWIVRGLMFTIRLVVLTVASLRIGFPQAADMIADEWLDRADAAGFPSRYANQLYNALWVTAMITIIAGWIVLSYMTVFLIALIGLIF